MEDVMLQDMQDIETSDSAGMCSSIVRAVMLDCHSFDNEKTVKLIQALKEKKELKFGEIILLLLLYIKPQVAANYFMSMYYAARKFKTFYDAYVWNISEYEVDVLLKEVSEYKKLFCQRLYTRVKESAYNIKNEDLDKKMNRDPFGRRQLYRDFVESNNFAANYECPANIRFETFLKYWLSMNQDQYTQGFLKTCYSSYARLESLAIRPFRLVRCSDVLKCISGCTIDQRNLVIGLYRALDKFAYEKEIIPKQYAKNLNIQKIHRKKFIVFSNAEVQALLNHRGEISVDITLVLLYTGIALREISYLEKSNVDDEYIYITKGSTKSSHRRIPIHPIISESLQRVLEYLIFHSNNDVSEDLQKARTQRMVAEVTLKYCGQKHSPIDCRRAFTNQLLVTGASKATVENLRGTQLELLHLYERIYIHQSPDCLKKAIMNLSWGGDS